MSENRVVVTGLGAVTPVGTGTREFFQGLKEGLNGIGKVTAFDVTDYRSKLAGEVKDFHTEDWIEKKSARRMDRFTQFSLAASHMAFTDAGLDTFSFNKKQSWCYHWFRDRWGTSSGRGVCSSCRERPQKSEPVLRFQDAD